MALDAADELIAGIRPQQWLAPTPCTDWNVRRVVEHVVGMNLVFAAMLSDRTPPHRGEDLLGTDPIGAYRNSANLLRAAFAQPGVLDRTYQSPLGFSTGSERLQIRLYDLLAHAWDLAQATGQSLHVPNDLVEQTLTFVQGQLGLQPRGDRFRPPQPFSEGAPAIDQLVAFLGRPLPTER